MSQPPIPPHSTHHQQRTTTQVTSSPPVAMADIQTLPRLPPPLLDHMSSASRQPSSRIQLPPLTIPHSTSRPGYLPPTTTHHYPTVHPAPTTQAPQPRSSYPGPAAPLDKLLSPHPSYSPPRLEAPYSPRSPPRSAVEYGGPSYHRRAMSEKYGYEELRHQPPEPQYMSPVDHRQPYSAMPSPASSYPPQFPGAHQQYRHAIGPPAVPPHVSAPSSYPSQGYNDPGAMPLPPRIAPSIPPPPHIAQQEKKYSTSDHVSRSYIPESDSNLRYELRVRQQPIAARACGFGERDRRVIDPPPIIQLMVTDHHGQTADLDELRYSLNVVHTTLWNADGTHEETALVQTDRRATRRLMGQLVASPSVAKDEHDTEGCFFCFPDLSCRTHGRYRLRFVLMRIDPANLQVGGSSPILTEVVSDVFTVYTAKDFPGMRPSSSLTRALKLQGCNIQVKKGNEKALARKRPAISSEDEADEKKKLRK